MNRTAAWKDTLSVVRKKELLRRSNYRTQHREDTDTEMELALRTRIQPATAASGLSSWNQAQPVLFIVFESDLVVIEAATS